MIMMLLSSKPYITLWLMVSGKLFIHIYALCNWITNIVFPKATAYLHLVMDSVESFGEGPQSVYRSANE